MTSEHLRYLRERLKTIDESIAAAKLERQGLQEAIAAETERLAQHAAAEADALELQIMLCRDQQMTTADIATRIGRSCAFVDKVAARFRKRHDLTIRRASSRDPRMLSRTEE